MLTFSFIVLAIIGAFFRRWWGGWQNPNHIIKVIVGFAIPLVAVFLGTHNIVFAATSGILIGISFLNPWHSRYMRFGSSDGDLPNPSFLTCFGIFSLLYGVFPLVLGVAGSFLGLSHWYAFLYGLSGVVASTFYGLGRKFWPSTLKVWLWNGCYFIDTQTAVGEIGIGFAVIGGLSLLFS